VKRQPGFTLLEVLLAAALFALTAAACLPLLASQQQPDDIVPDPSLALIAAARQPVLQPNAEIARFGSVVGEYIVGEWVVVQAGGRIAVVWEPIEPDTAVRP
jgi:prepilin-type N-terminal cleavage/methylation domain-containing protein